MIQKILSKLWIIAWYGIIPAIAFGIFMSFTIEYLDEYVIINSGNQTDARIVDYFITKEEVEDERENVNIVDVYNSTIEFHVNSQIKNFVKQMSYYDFKKIYGKEFSITYFPKNPKIFYIDKFQELPSRSEWYWKRLSIIIILASLFLASTYNAIQKIRKFKLEDL